MKKTETDRFLPHRPTHRSSPRKAPFPTEEKVVAHRGTNPHLQRLESHCLLWRAIRKYIYSLSYHPLLSILNRSKYNPVLWILLI